MDNDQITDFPREMDEVILSCLRGIPTPGMQEQLRQWLEASQENREYYRRFSADYYRINFSGKWNRINLPEATGQVIRRHRLRKRMRRIGYALAGTAAALLLSWGATDLLSHRQHPERVFSATAGEELHGGIRQALLTLPDGREIALGESRVLDLGHILTEEDSIRGLTYQVRDSSAMAGEMNTLVVPRGGLYVMTLSDNSRLWINSETEVRFPAVFAADKREIFVRGEVFLEVARDEKRPFSVHTLHTETRVLGTAFNVMAYGDDPETEVTLISGSVEVQAGEARNRLTEGEQFRLDSKTGEVAVQAVNTSHYASWKEGIFDFDDMTLEELCGKLGRWYDVEFLFIDNDARQKRFTGAVKRDNTLRFMLDFIEKTSEVQFVVNDRMIEIVNQ